MNSNESNEPKSGFFSFLKKQEQTDRNEEVYGRTETKTVSHGLPAPDEKEWDNIYAVEENRKMF